MTTTYEDAKTQLLDAMLAHVPFDGWSETSFRMAIVDCDMDDVLARATCPRGAVDLALAFHARGDAAMVERLKSEDLSDLKFRDRIAAAVRFRLEAVEDKELVRRGVTLFSLPMHAADGAKAMWQTCDLIWETLGDTSDDVNWYTKRATLSGVYSSTVLFWLGDDSPNHQKSWEFLDRRIDNVMQFEKIKAQVNGNPLFKPFLAVPNWLAGQVKAPMKMKADLPGMLNPRK
ncbi:COQ9 family protein [Ruegeria sp. HKCCA5426]|uniref:COQ9 family protein n=1 Tax=Ruegeria sp. HKCCA5426 TaxID=2682985 RepID=UPI0014898225|nr:COQ9 family protein [Ruegeria sp. HKCCA5426]